MKRQMLAQLAHLKKDLGTLKRDVNAIPTDRVGRAAARKAADAIATTWVEKLRSPLEHKFKLPADVIKATSDQMKRLHVLARPNNLKSSYLDTINQVLRKFDDKFVLPIKQSALEVESVFDLTKLVPGLPDPAESDYLREAVECATSGHRRAAVVMGWCAVIDRIQKKIVALGFNKFNATSSKLSAQKTGKFKRWNKTFNMGTLSELQEVFDRDLIVIIEGMGLIDGNQAERLQTCYQYRNHSAHPGEAPIEDPHVLSFFSDISSIILQNPKLAV